MNSSLGNKDPQPAYLVEAVEPEALGRAEVAKGYAWNAIFSFAGKAVFPILQILFYRKLGPEQIGIYAVLIPIYMICESLRDAGLALTYVADRDADRHREGQYASLAILNALAFAAILVGCRHWIAKLLNLPQLDWGLQMVAAAIVLTGFSTIPANKLQKKARFRDAGLVDFFSTFASYVLAIALVFSGFGFKALIWQFIAKAFFFTLGCCLLEPVKPFWIRIDVLRAIWMRSTHNLLNNMLFTVYTVADNLMITRLFGPVAVGNYNAAYTFGMKPVDFFSSPLGKTLLIAYTRKNHDLKALANLFTRTIAVSVLLMLPLYVLIGLFARPMAVLLLSSKFALGGDLLAVLAIYCGCRSVGLLCGNVLVSMNRPVLNVYGWLLAYATVGVILYVNRSHLGLFTAVWALTAGAAVVYVWNAMSAFWILRPNAENRAKLWRAFGLAGAASVAILCAWTLPFGVLTDLAIAALVVPLFYLAGVSALYGGTPVACLSKSGLKRVWAAI